MKKLILLLALLLGWPALSEARQRAYGFCSVGTTASVVGLAVTPGVQGSYPGCQVKVFLTGTTTLATIFIDNLGNSEANPFTGNLSTGYWEFYADDGRYDVQISGAGLAAPFTYGDILLNTSTGSGGGGTAVGPQFTVQTSNGAGGFQAGGSLDTGSSFQMNEDGQFKGPNPWTDIRSFVAVSRNPNLTPTTPGISGSIVSGTTSLVLNTASTFVNGEGVVVYGAGAAHALSTPSVPTVTPSIAAAGTGTGNVVAGPVGATSYAYVIVARTLNQGLTAASAQGSTATGAAALGAQSVNITSCTKATNIVTCLTATPHTMSVGSMVYVLRPSEGTFNGWWQVATVPDSTHFTYLTGLLVANGAPSVSTGGTANWWGCNHITWTAVTGATQYYIYGRTAGGLTRIGASLPQGLTPTLFFDDFGSPMMDGLTLPFFVPSTPPVSATSNSLFTTIVSGAGTTTLVLANAAGTTVSGQTVLSDEGSAILAAAAVGGTVYIPYGTYVVNRSIDTTSINGGTVAVAQTGALNLNDTWKGQNFQWAGQTFPSGSCGTASFGFNCSAGIFPVRAYPGLWTSGGVIGLRDLNVTTQINGLGMVIDQGQNPSFTNVSFQSSGNDYMGVGLYIEGIITNSTFALSMRHLTLSAGTPGGTSGVGQTATPYFICNQCGEARMEVTMMNHRGIYWVGNDLVMTGGRMQGGVTPVIMVAPTQPGNFQIGLSISQFELDTMAEPCVAVFNTGAGVAGPSGSLGCTPAGSDVSQPSTLTGNSSQGVVSSGNGSIATMNAMGNNMNVSGALAAGATVNNTNPNPGLKVIGTSIGYLMVPLTPTVAVGAHSSCTVNCVGAGTYFYSDTAIDLTARESDIAPPISATTDGTQTIQVCWTLLPGQVATRLFRGPSALNLSATTLPGVGGVGGATTCYNDLSTIIYAVSPVVNSGGASSSISAGGVASPAYSVTGSGFSATATPAPFTANRTWFYPDVNGFVPITSYFNSFYDNFNRANGAVGANYVTFSSSCPGAACFAPNVSSNQLVAGAGFGTHGSTYINKFSGDQFAQVTWQSATTANTSFGLLMRMLQTVYDSQGDACQVAGTAPTTFKIVRLPGNTLLNSSTGTLSPGDVLRCTAQGTTITFTQNGTVVATAVDSLVLVTGFTGFEFLQNNSNVDVVDNLSLGNLHPLIHADLEQDFPSPQHFSSLTVGSPLNPPISRYALFSSTLTPVAVGANTCAEQTFTVTGILAADIAMNGDPKPTHQAGLTESWIVTATNTAGVNFCNNTAGAITPTAAEVYKFVVVQ